jgi:hypothetical protein
MVSKFRGRNFFKGVECNIPPVSIGILPVDRARGLIFKESKYGGYLLHNVSLIWIKYQCRFKTLEARAIW